MDTVSRWAGLARAALLPLLPLLLIGGAGAARAQAPSPTCVEVVTARGDAAGLLRLVRDEVDRHPSHHAVDPLPGAAPGSEDEGCPTHLRVEIIEVTEGRFLTARVNEAVPHRERIEGKDAAALTTALSRALTIVLHNDPVTLRGPASENWLAQKGGALRRKGQNLFGAELTQTSAWVDGGVDTLPGLSVVARREIEDWHLAVHLSGAWAPASTSDRNAHLSMLAGGGVDVAHFFDALSDTSFFVGGGLGLIVQRFEGPATYLETGARGTANKLLLEVNGRAGVEMFRTADTRVSFFAHLSLPTFPSRDRDQGVIDAWVPTGGLGVGAAF